MVLLLVALHLPSCQVPHTNAEYSHLPIYYGELYLLCWQRRLTKTGEMASSPQMKAMTAAAVLHTRRFAQERKKYIKLLPDIYAKSGQRSVIGYVFFQGFSRVRSNLTGRVGSGWVS